MNIKVILGYIREGDLMPFYRRFLARIIWPIFHRSLAKSRAVRVMEQSWDYLIVLDACRYDTYREVVDEGANYAIAGATSTGQWMRWNFREKYEDVIYIAGNPHLASANLKKRLGFNPFYMVREVWDYGWDSTLKTVPPEQVTNAALETLKSFPEKRMIIHYVQPHHPYIADKGLLETDEGAWHALEGGLWSGRRKDTPLKLAKRGEIPVEKVKKAYEENLKAVMKEVKRLERELPGRVVLTADHGEAFGEYGHYGHGAGLRIEGLVKVPWVVLKDERRRPTKELDVERTRAKARIMKLKDSGRLYKPPQNPLNKG
jgi:hypothetical protein